MTDETVAKLHLDRLIAGIVGDARVDQVDRDAFQRNAAASAGLTQRDDQNGPVLAQQRIERGQRARELGRQFRANNTITNNKFTIECARYLERRVDGLAAERIESGHQHGWRFLLRVLHRNTNTAIRTTLTTSSASAVGHCARITAYWSRSSSSTAGTMLKFAAIGVSSVPQ